MNIRDEIGNIDRTIDTNAVQFLASTECSLRDTAVQDMIHMRMLLHAMVFQLPLLSNEGLKIRLGWLHYRSFDPSLLQQPIKQLPEEVERGVFIPANDDFRAETTQTLTNEGTSSFNWENVPIRFLQGVTGAFAKLWVDILASDLLRYS